MLLEALKISKSAVLLLQEVPRFHRGGGGHSGILHQVYQVGMILPKSATRDHGLLVIRYLRPSTDDFVFGFHLCCEH